MIRQQCESFGRSVFWNRQIDRENVGLYGGKKVSHFIFRFCWSRKDNSTTERWTDLLFKYCLQVTQSPLFISRKRQTCRKIAFFGFMKGPRLLKTCFVCDSSSYFGGKCHDSFHPNALCVCVVKISLRLPISLFYLAKFSPQWLREMRRLWTNVPWRVVRELVS